ncbi:hypothetical protein EDC94DRAFT_591157 [Helicostylum pulchrum]|nr:hypothetical protein EDC94DRAFT_591157 [Helicostylum pulchrum]
MSNMSNNNNSDIPWNSTDFLQDVFENTPSDTVKLDFLIGEVSEIKIMLSRLLAMNNRDSLNSVSFRSGSVSAGTSQLSITPASFDIINDREKVDEIVMTATSNRGKRCYSRRDILLKTGISESKKKDLIVAMCTIWLEAKEISYGMATEMEEKAARYQDASDRYDKTNVLIGLFCKTKFSEEDKTFRWMNLSKEKRELITYVVEHIVFETLTRQSCLPLDFAKDSWVTTHLLSVAIRNSDGSRKAKSTEDNADSFSISDLAEEVELPQVQAYSAMYTVLLSCVLYVTIMNYNLNITITSHLLNLLTIVYTKRQ